MQALKCIKKQLNFTKKWIVAVANKGETMTSDALIARMMYKHGYNRKEISDIAGKIKHEIMEELLCGNTVDVFGLVKIKAEYSPRKKFSGNEEEASLIASRMSIQDIKTKLKANINQTFNHKYVKMFKSDNQKDALAH